MEQMVRFDTERLREDIALRGWQPADLADQAQVARSTVTRFLSGESQTARTAAKLASTLGYSVRRYIKRRAA